MELSIIQQVIHEIRGQKVMLDFDLAFTEHGVTMVASILKSERAIQIERDQPYLSFRPASFEKCPVLRRRYLHGHWI